MTLKMKRVDEKASGFSLNTRKASYLVTLWEFFHSKLTFKSSNLRTIEAKFNFENRLRIKLHTSKIHISVSSKKPFESLIQKTKKKKPEPRSGFFKWRNYFYFSSTLHSRVLSEAPQKTDKKIIEKSIYRENSKRKEQKMATASRTRNILFRINSISFFYF